MLVDGLSDNFLVIKAWLNKKNGNGVYLAYNKSLKRLDIIVVFNDGFNTDFILVYCSNSLHYACDFNHSITTHAAIERAIKYSINK